MHWRRLAVIFSVAGILCAQPLAGHSQSSEIEIEWRTLHDAQAAHQRGWQAAARGDKDTATQALTEAGTLYRQLIERNPLRRDLHAPLVDTLVRRGNATAGYAIAIQQIRGGSKDLPLAVQRIRALIGLRSVRGALDEAQKLSLAHPNDPIGLAILGEAAAEAGDTTLAISSLQRALGRSLPKDPQLDTGIELSQLRLILARSLLSANRTTEVASALADLPAASHPEALFLLGQAELASDKPAQAASTLSRALQVSDAPAVRSRGTALLAQALSQTGRTTEAIAVLRKAGDEPSIQLALARMYMEDKPPNPPAAVMVLERAVQQDQTHLALCLAHVAALRAADRLPQALIELRRCEGLSAPLSDGIVLATQRAQLQLRLGRLDEAVVSLRFLRGKIATTAPQQKKLTEQLSYALLQRALDQLSRNSLPPAALADVEEAHRLTPSPEAVQALALALLASGRPAEAIAQLAPLCDAPQTDLRLLTLCARSYREAGQLSSSLTALQRAEVLPPAEASASLMTAYVQERAATLIALGRPLEALRQVQGNDEDAQRTRAAALLATIRAFYQTQRPQGTLPKGASPTTRGGPDPAAARGKAGRGPLPPLRGPIELADAQISRGTLPPLRAADAESTSKAPRGPLPPLRGADDHASAAGPALNVPPVLSEDRHVLTYAQAILRLGSVLSSTERAEAMLYLVIALSRLGQFELALKRLHDVSGQFDQATLDSLMGPSGLQNLRARLTLRGGDFYQGASLAQQTLPTLKPPVARALQSAMSSAFTNKAIDLLERGETDRANSLLRTVVTFAQAGGAEAAYRAQYNLAILQLVRGRLDDAKAVLTRLDPQQFPSVHLGLGCYHDLSGDPRAALDSYRRYLASPEPGDPSLPLVRQWVDLLERIHEGARP